MAATPFSLGEACDRAAGLPKDVDIVTPDRTILEGVIQGRSEALEAVVQACGSEARAEPNEARYAHRAGLALSALGRGAEAVVPLTRAMELGYAGGYLAVAEGRANGTFGPAPPKDARASLAVGMEGIARNGSPEIKRGIGNLLAHSDTPVRDRARGRRLIEEAAAAGHPSAAADLAQVLAQNEGSARDATRIRTLLEGAVAGGSRRAALLYGRLLHNGMGLHHDPAAARRLYLLAAERGDVEGMTSVAAMMREVDGGPKDIEGQRRWLGRASALGNLEARRALGNSYLDEEPSRGTLGLVLLEQLAEGGSVEAAHGLGVRFQEAYGVLRDYRSALKWFRQAAEAGDGRAMKQLGVIYDEGQGVPIDHAEARRWYDRAREKGVAEAYTAIGMQYDHAMGVPRDLARAFDWYRQGASHGAAASMNNLGFAYEQGRGVRKNLKEALRWYEAAVAQDDRTAQLNLANLYFNGRGVAKDRVRRLKLLQRSAEQGLPQALNDLALMEMRRPSGSGTRAVELLRQAATGGAAVAYNNLGMALMQGWDAAPDHVEATYWFRRSVERASDLDPMALSESQFQLGYNLLIGRGVARDSKEGWALILAAVEARNPTALSFVAKSGRRMNPAHATRREASRRR
ncbi:tetratricopeptide repeat protein [Methylobacterium iners]|uniref:tetratricopeptide repeat protein n=1 Tax=Methylobacterium iners TaxID=418707 RepID=UPI001EE1F655|nr:hypothetical protein [Methylobacterium iners]